jgi:hypothetical protein
MDRSRGVGTGEGGAEGVTEGTCGRAAVVEVELEEDVEEGAVEEAVVEFAVALREAQWGGAASLTSGGRGEGRSLSLPSSAITNPAKTSAVATRPHLILPAVSRNDRRARLGYYRYILQLVPSVDVLLILLVLAGGVVGCAKLK